VSLLSGKKGDKVAPKEAASNKKKSAHAE